MITRRSFSHRLLSACSAIALGVLAPVGAAFAELGEPEKDELKFGFIKLTDMAPLAVAYENGYFEDEGLYVTLEAQANWKVLLDGVIDGQLDGAHMLAGQPLAATIGFGTKAHIVTPFSMDLNGNGITVSNAIWKAMKEYVPMADGKPVHPIKADYLKPVVEQYIDDGKPFNMGMVFPVSTHNYELRYWLAAGGIHPGYYAPHKGDISGQIDAQALLSVTPPPHDACNPGGRHDLWLLRRRTVEPAGRVQGHRRTGDHRLRNLEKQSREGLWPQQDLHREVPQHHDPRCEGPASSCQVAG